MVSCHEAKHEGLTNMIVQLLETIHQVTLSMEMAIKEGNITEFDQLINSRQELMDQVDEYRLSIPNHQYSPEERKILEKILRIDQNLTPTLEEQLNETYSILNQIRKSKQVSKYRPYMKQLNGAFIDRKK